MFTICVFRRYGILAPVMIFLLGCLLELLVEKKHPGEDYYATHMWTIGLTFTLSGLFLTVFVWIMAPPQQSHSSSQGDYAALDLDLPTAGGSLLPKTDTASTRFLLEALPTKDDLYQFAVTPSEADMFCYIPMNWCALGVLGTGVLLMLVDAIKCGVSLL